MLAILSLGVVLLFTLDLFRRSSAPRPALAPMTTTDLEQDSPLDSVHDVQLDKPSPPTLSAKESVTNAKPSGQPSPQANESTATKTEITKEWKVRGLVMDPDKIHVIPYVEIELHDGIGHREQVTSDKEGQFQSFTAFDLGSLSAKLSVGGLDCGSAVFDVPWEKREHWIVCVSSVVLISLPPGLTHEPGRRRIGRLCTADVVSGARLIAQQDDLVLAQNLTGSQLPTRWQESVGEDGGLMCFARAAIGTADISKLVLQLASTSERQIDSFGVQQVRDPLWSTTHVLQSQRYGWLQVSVGRSAPDDSKLAVIAVPEGNTTPWRAFLSPRKGAASNTWCPCGTFQILTLGNNVEPSSQSIAVSDQGASLVLNPTMTKTPFGIIKCINDALSTTQERLVGCTRVSSLGRQSPLWISLDGYGPEGDFLFLPDAPECASGTQINFRVVEAAFASGDGSVFVKGDCRESTDIVRSSALAYYEGRRAPLLRSVRIAAAEDQSALTGYVVSPRVLNGTWGTIRIPSGESVALYGERDAEYYAWAPGFQLRSVTISDAANATDEKAASNQGQSIELDRGWSAVLLFRYESAPVWHPWMTTFGRPMQGLAIGGCRVSLCGREVIASEDGVAALACDATPESVEIKTPGMKVVSVSRLPEFSLAPVYVVVLRKDIDETPW